MAKPSLKKLMAEGGGLSGFPWPENCGDFDMRIDRAGQWYYRGSPIGRLALVKLFATVLQRDEKGEYWLVTPGERGRIIVDDLPFQVIECQVENQGRADQTLNLRTNLDYWVKAGPDHEIATDPLPKLHVRDGLWARVSRPVYYQLVELADIDEQAPDCHRLQIKSGGVTFTLGTFDPNQLDDE